MKKIIFIIMAALILLTPNMVMACIPGGVCPTISIPDVEVGMQEEVTVPITIKYVNDLGAYDIWLHYGQNVEVVAIEEADLFIVHNVVDRIVRICGWDTCGISGDVVLANITLKPVGCGTVSSDGTEPSGTSILDIEVVGFWDTSGKAIGHVVEDGVFTIIETIKGDVDLDKEITIVDALLIAQYLVGNGELENKQLINADISNDGVVSIVDAMLIAQSLV